jgi:uncharacterized membrane protein YhaH (DUF805 family)
VSYTSTFANPAGRTSRGAFLAALITLLAATGFYWFFVKAGRNGEWVLVTLLFPAFVLHARRLHDIGQTAWLLVLPFAPILAFTYLHLFSPGGQYERPLTWASLALALVFMLWGLIGRGQDGANRFGEAA